VRSAWALVDISDLTIEAVLAALYNAATPRGLGFHSYDARPMDIILAHHVINERGDDLPHRLHKLLPDSFPVPKPCRSLVFDYVFGRPLKIDLSTQGLAAQSYDGIHGGGRAQLAVSILRNSGNPADDRIMQLHFSALKTVAQQEWDELTPECRAKVFASRRNGEHPEDSIEHVLASILFPLVN
jgi:hypothetical protein